MIFSVHQQQVGWAWCVNGIRFLRFFFQDAARQRNGDEEHGKDGPGRNIVLYGVGNDLVFRFRRIILYT